MEEGRSRGQWQGRRTWRKGRENGGQGQRELWRERLQMSLLPSNKGYTVGILIVHSS